MTARTFLAAGALAAALALSLGGAAPALAQQTDVTAGSAADSATGTDGNVVTGRPNRRASDVPLPPVAPAPAPAAAPGSSAPTPGVIPPNPATSLIPTITTETTLDGEIVEPAPEPAPAPAPAPERDGPTPAPGGHDGTATSTATDGGLTESVATACGYPTWLDAQTALEGNAALAETLDPDGDGIACEEAMYAGTDTASAAEA